MFIYCFCLLLGKWPPSLQFWGTVKCDAHLPSGCRGGHMTQDWPVMVLDLLIYSKLLKRWVRPVLHFSTCACTLCHFSRVRLFGTLLTVAARLLCPWDFPGKNTGWVAMPFSRGSSQPRGWTLVSLLAGSFFTTSITWEAPPFPMS